MDPTQIINQLLAAAGIPAGTLPQAIDLSLWNILRSIFVLVIAFLLARWARNFLARTFKRINLEPRVASILLPLTYYGIILLGIIWVIGGMGLALIALVVVGGLALQDLVKNFASGMLILATRPFHPGDWIMVEDKEGIVNEIGWRGTFIDSFDGRRVIVPNSNIVTNVVTNNSIKPQLRSTLRFSVPMNSEFARVEALMLEALRDVQGISTEPAPRVLLDSLSGDAMNLMVWIWILDPVNQFRVVLSNAQRAIKEHLQANDIVLNPASTVVKSMGADEKLFPK